VLARVMNICHKAFGMVPQSSHSGWPTTPADLDIDEDELEDTRKSAVHHFLQKALRVTLILWSASFVFLRFSHEHPSELSRY
jgi:hypothetical protein